MYSLNAHRCWLVAILLLVGDVSAEIILCKNPKIEGFKAVDEPENGNNSDWQRVAYEPNNFGYTVDGNDANYIDINLSLKWSPVDDALSIPESRRQGVEKSRSCNGTGLPYVYLAFSTRQAFYYSTRSSSPVIGQRFNPKIIGRYWLKKDGYVDFSYSHESNGQSINNEKAYNDLQLEMEQNDNDPSYAKEYISRGWDFLETSWKVVRPDNPFGSGPSNYYFTARYFLENGIFQDEPEEVNSWEQGYNGLSRSQVDGLLFLANWDLGDCQGNDWLCVEKLAFKFGTGYEDTLENNNVRFEFGVKLANAFPFTLWYSSGYNSDLIDYYRYVKGVGISLELGSF